MRLRFALFLMLLLPLLFFSTPISPADAELSELPPDVKTELSGYLQVLSQGWDQDAVDSANAILSNTSYNAAAWDDFFSEYFSKNPFNDHLRDYLFLPVFWWFDQGVHLRLQEGLIPPFSTLIQLIFEDHWTDLSGALGSNSTLLETLMNSHQFFSELAEFGVVERSIRQGVFDFYVSLIKTYPSLLTKDVSFDTDTKPYLAVVRAQTQINVRDTLELTPGLKDMIADTLRLSGSYLEIWSDFSVLLFDNLGFDQNQLSVVTRVLKAIPPRLHDLGAITQNELLGNVRERYRPVSHASGGINIFNMPVGSAAENGFPEDIDPKYSDVFSLVLVHEVNHVVDAHWVSGQDFLATRRQDIIEQAGNDSMNYLRSMFPDGFFTEYPQEFFASISNQWFSDTFHTLQLALTRFSKGFHEPINQFLFLADVYSLGLNETMFYTLDTEGNITTSRVSLTRDSNHHVDHLVYDGRRYFFDLDDEGNVLGWRAQPKQYLVKVDSEYGEPRGQGWYDEGSTATVSVDEIVPIVEGSRAQFVQWTGDVSSPQATVSFTVDAPKTLEADWKLQHFVTVSSPYGNPTGEDWYDEGSTATVSVEDTVPIVEGSRAVFEGWTGDVVSADPSISFTVDSPKTVIATWKLQHFLTIEKSHLEGAVDASSDWHDEGTTLTITAEDVIEIVLGQTRVRFTGWAGDLTSADLSITVTMDRPKTLVASWKTQHYLTVESQLGKPAGEGWYDEGSTATFSVTPLVGPLAQEVFTGWSGDSTSTEATATVVMDSPKTVTATWRTAPSELLGEPDYTQLILLVAGVALAVGAGVWLIRRRK